MKTITPCLWFDDQTEEVAKYYISIFTNSKINKISKYVVDTPSHKPLGSTMMVTFSLNGYEMMALNGGAYFKVNPSISFTVVCKKK